MPEVEDYFLFVDTSLQVEEKIKFHEKIAINQKWSFKGQLLQSVNQEATITLKACTKFLNSCFSFQENIKTFLDINDKNLIHPFDKRILSISGYTFTVCSYYFLKQYLIFGVNFEYSGNFVNTSRGELEFVTFKAHTEPEKNWIHHYNSISGQKTFKNYKVDLWSPEGTVYEYYGCEFHYHLPPHCRINVGKNDFDLNCKKIPFSELKLKDQKVKNELLTTYSNEVNEVKIMFECEWAQEKLHPNYLDFQQKFEHFLKRPLHRLIPRTAVRSGLSDVYNLCWEKELFPDEQFLYSDIQGLYSQSAIENEFPIGQVVIFIGHDLDLKITFRDGFHFYEEKKLICGSAFIKVQAPANLKKPFLQYRVSDQFNFLALCKECCISKAKKCGHYKSNLFESVWMLSDIRKAAKLGYKVLAWYEIHYFPETAPILKDYSKLLYSEKIKNSGFPSDVTSIEEKLLYCEKINDKMNLPDIFKLTPENVKNNPALRQMAKNQLNNFYGKFCQNSNQTETHFVKSQFSLEEFFRTKKVIDVFNVVENVVQVEVEHIDRKLRPQSNIYIGAQIR